MYSITNNVSLFFRPCQWHIFVTGRRLKCSFTTSYNSRLYSFNRITAWFLSVNLTRPGVLHGSIKSTLDFTVPSSLFSPPFAIGCIVFGLSPPQYYLMAPKPSQQESSKSTGKYRYVEITALFVCASILALHLKKNKKNQIICKSFIFKRNLSWKQNPSWLLLSVRLWDDQVFEDHSLGTIYSFNYDNWAPSSGIQSKSLIEFSSVGSTV